MMSVRTVRVFRLEPAATRPVGRPLTFIQPCSTDSVSTYHRQDHLSERCAIRRHSGHSSSYLRCVCLVKCRGRLFRIGGRGGEGAEAVKWFNFNFNRFPAFPLRPLLAAESLHNSRVRLLSHNVIFRFCNAFPFRIVSSRARVIGSIHTPASFHFVRLPFRFRSSRSVTIPVQHRTLDTLAANNRSFGPPNATAIR